MVIRKVMVVCLCAATVFAVMNLVGCAKKYSCDVTKIDKNGQTQSSSTQKVDVGSCAECQKADKSCTDEALKAAGYIPGELRDCKDASDYQDCFSCQGRSYTFSSSDVCE
jgi:hypothetical protein